MNRNLYNSITSQREEIIWLIRKYNQQQFEKVRNPESRRNLSDPEGWGRKEGVMRDREREKWDFFICLTFWKTSIDHSVPNTYKEAQTDFKLCLDTSHPSYRIWSKQATSWTSIQRIN